MLTFSSKPGIRRVWLAAALLAQTIGGLVFRDVSAQTADPSATPPSASSAPAAKAGTYSISAGNLVVAPGLVVPNGNTPWALDTAPDGKPALVPIHHAAISEPATVASAPPESHVLNGLHARTALRTATPVLLLHTNDRTENTGDAGHGNPTGWVLVAAEPVGADRSLPHVQFSQIAAGTSCAAPLVCLKAETLPDGWARLTPESPLQPGEYVLMPVHRQPKPGVLVVYDFTIAPGAPLATDAVVAGATPAPAGRRKHS